MESAALMKPWLKNDGVINIGHVSNVVCGRAIGARIVIQWNSSASLRYISQKQQTPRVIFKEIRNAMIELRQDSLQQSKSLRWISILLGAILVALGIHSYVLIRRDFKEHSLSSELKELRKMVEELSSKVAKTEGKNENLREELFNTEVKLENLQ